MAITRLLISVTLLGAVYRAILPFIGQGLAGDHLAGVRVVSLVVFGLLLLIVIVRSTKDVMWCMNCTCRRCTLIKHRHLSTW